MLWDCVRTSEEVETSRRLNKSKHWKYKVIIMLTLEMQKALVQGIRNQQAKRLKKERFMFRSGINHLSKSKSYNFIEHKTVNIFTLELVGKSSIGTLNGEFVKATKGITSHDYNLDMTFYSESDCTCDDRCYCFEESRQMVTIKKDCFQFKTLTQTRRSITSLIDYCIRDAKFKLVHQPNGKDSKRFMKVIEANM